MLWWGKKWITLQERGWDPLKARSKVFAWVIEKLTKMNQCQAELTWLSRQITATITQHEKEPVKMKSQLQCKIQAKELNIYNLCLKVLCTLHDCCCLFTLTLAHRVLAQPLGFAIHAVSCPKTLCHVPRSQALNHWSFDYWTTPSIYWTTDLKQLNLYFGFKAAYLVWQQCFSNISIRPLASKAPFVMEHWLVLEKPIGVTLHFLGLNKNFNAHLSLWLHLYRVQRH